MEEYDTCRAVLEEIKIAGHSNRKGTLAKLLEQRPGEFDAIIITNNDHPFPEWVTDKVTDCLHLVFDDITSNQDSKLAPKIEHVKKALDWATAKPRKRIVVACHAGVSRSSATAFLIGCKHWGPGLALSVLRQGSHWPNPLVVRHGASILDSEEIWRRYVEWYNQATGNDLIPDFDEDLQADQEEIQL